MTLPDGRTILLVSRVDNIVLLTPEVQIEDMPVSLISGKVYLPSHMKCSKMLMPSRVEPMKMGLGGGISKTH